MKVTKHTAWWLLIPLLLLTLECSKKGTEPQLPTLTASPSSIQAQAPFAGFAIDRTVAVSGAGGAVLPYTFETDAPWMTLFNANSTTNGQTPDTFRIDFRVTRSNDTLPVGVHVDTIVLTSDDAGNSPYFIEVTMIIGSELKLTPGSLRFEAALDGNNPPSQGFLVKSSSPTPLNYTMVKNASWLSLSADSGATSDDDTIGVSVDITGIGGGLFVDTIVISSFEAFNSPQNMYCTLFVSSWVPQTSVFAQNLEDVVFLDAQHGFAVGVISSVEDRTGYIIETDDGGENWYLNMIADTNSELSQLTNSLFGAVSFATTLQGWVVGEGGIILKTLDGGGSWHRQIVPADVDTLRFNDIAISDADTAWVVGNGGVVLKTTDGGNTWTKFPSGTNQNLFAVSFSDASNGWVAGDGNTIIHTVNGGASWGPQGAVSNDYRDIFFADQNHGWAVGKFGSIIHTDNGGVLWSPQTSGINGRLFSLYFRDAMTGWIVGEDGVALHTVDGGLNWSQQFTFTQVDLLGVYFIDAMTGWTVGETGVIRHTRSAGE